MAEATQHSTPSRYKSQRRNQASVDDTPSPDLPPTPPVEDGLVRSKSRYHRKTDAPPDSPPTEPALPVQGVAPSRYHSSKHRQSPMQPIYKEQIVHRPRTNTATQRTEERMPSAGREYRSTPGDETVSGAEDTHGPRRVGDRYQNTQRNAGVALPASPPQFPPVTAPTGDLFPPPMPVEPPPPPRVDGPPQSGQIRATKSTSDLNRHESSGEAGCFGGLFKRKRGEPTTESAQAVRPRTAKGDLPVSRPGAAAGPDAPVSAINAGDRHVLVESGKSRTLFPVTPTTTATDLIKSAATCMSERIDIKSAILLEHFSTVGVHRPLRRYEHIREVMNSWDNDRQNSLILFDPGTGTIEPELTLAGVPKTEPEEQTFCLLYSQKAGKWDKRFITLRSNGQLACQKDAGSSKDLSIICHLTDFDIYTPTAERQKKKIKPPKKHCFAVKSQQKTSLFESTHDFVHFFSTGDRAEADGFYKAVQSWRSWYLVNVKGEGQKEKEKEKAKPVVVPTVAKDRSTSNEQLKVHRAKPSTDSHYQLGSFRPFSIDMNQFEERPSSSKSDHGPSRGFEKSSNQFNVNISPERRTSSAKRQHPPVALNKRPQLAEDEPLANLNRSSSVNKRRPSSDQKRPDTSEFKDSGLLGRKYSQRRKEYSDQEADRNRPFTAGPNLLNGGAVDDDYSGDGLRRNTSVRRSGNGEVKRSNSVRDSSRNGGHARGTSIDLDRSGTRRQKPKPLIDLTPQFQEPPQHVKVAKGRGYHPDHIDQNGLITNATTPEDPLGLPQQTTFRNTSGQNNGPTSPALLDFTPQPQQPIHHVTKGRGYHPETPSANGGLVGSATSPEDPLGPSQNTTLRGKRTGSGSEPQQRQISGSRTSDGFTGEGLLASAQNRQGWGGSSKGRGVIDGSRANGRPLVDLTADSRFAQGSLLNQVERAAGGPIPPPVIDRERRYEREEKYGEGY